MNTQETARLAYRHHQSGDFAAAEKLYREVLAREPHNADVMHVLGLLCHQTMRTDEGIALLRRAVEIQPGKSDVFNNLGTLLRESNHVNEAIDAYRAAIKLKPDYAAAHQNLSAALWQRGRLDEAMQSAQTALRLTPTSPGAHNSLGTILHALKRPDEAIAAYRQALQLNPRMADVWTNLGVSLQDIGRWDEAIDAYKKAVEIQPTYAPAHCDIGYTLREIGRLEDAIESFRHAVHIDPNYVEAHSNLLLSLHYREPHDPDAIFQEHLAFAKQHETGLASSRVPLSNTLDRNRRIRIGYVSPDFRRHSVNYFIEPALEHHDHDRFEIFCYADEISSDKTTDRVRTLADTWRNIRGMTDAEVAELIRGDRIDILIDLAGHTGYNRIRVFARKPAPIQVNYLGYPDTSGMNAMDYRLTDSFADPPGTTEGFHTEQLMRLDPCAWCYRPPEESLELPPPAPRANEPITFGCFNIVSKITSQMIALWSHILSATPNSRLVVRSQSAELHSRVLEIFAGQNIRPPQLIVHGRTASYTEHLRLYESIDIMLDPFPYHGTTTTCESLWMGVPVITLAGHTHVSRVGVSLLNAVGLPELIAQSPDEYVKLATDLANDRSRVDALRVNLRDQMRQSPLCQADGFTQRLERAYTEMWQHHCTKGNVNSE